MNAWRYFSLFKVMLRRFLWQETIELNIERNILSSPPTRSDSVIVEADNVDARIRSL